MKTSLCAKNSSRKLTMKGLPIILISILLLFPFMVQAGIMDTILYLLFGAGNPCETYGTYAGRLCNLIDKVANILYFVGWALAFVVILIGGITVMTSGGNEDNLKKGKKIITNGLIGAAVILCAGFILGLLVEVLWPLL